jgi:TnpA family transposase
LSKTTGVKQQKNKKNIQGLHNLVAKSVRKKKQVGLINRLSKQSLQNWPEKWIAKLGRGKKTICLINGLSN